MEDIHVWQQAQLLERLAILFWYFFIIIIIIIEIWYFFLAYPNWINSYWNKESLVWNRKQREQLCKTYRVTRSYLFDVGNKQQ